MIKAKIAGSSHDMLSKNQQITFHSELTTNLIIPDNLTALELEIFLSSNMYRFDDLLEIKINNITDTYFEFENGELINANSSDQSTDLVFQLKNGDCSFEGVRSCAQTAMYAKGTFSKIICAFGFPACYAEEVANCVEKNCF